MTAPGLFISTTWPSSQRPSHALLFQKPTRPLLSYKSSISQPLLTCYQLSIPTRILRRLPESRVHRVLLFILKPFCHPTAPSPLFNYTHTLQLLYNMQASRAFSRVITAGSKTTTRQLHMTASAPFSSLLTTNQPIALGSNARQSVLASIPMPDTTDTGKPVRYFNTSRSLKSVGDSSTIDFMFIPDFDPDLNSAPLQVRVPLLPWAHPSEEVRAMAFEAEEPVRFIFPINLSCDLCKPNTD